MSKVIEIDYPSEITFELPAGVNQRLHYLLDKQDSGNRLDDKEREEAEGLVSLAESLSFLKMRATRLGQA